ncbi:putative Zinc finger, C2H2 type family protein [Blattamonas nauphoetae]|uniref:Zinc finger, C2H2 type family protein n=1 Tax=Blattamonas nauphoetae TaxID=2049346 RepID=A0ABQ9XZJ2_9EUKA|nr:putative Zinc finger, C2H2 type family protein [Blattamonas nauphoetae]
MHEEIEAFLANKNVQSDPATYEKIESFRLRLEGILKDKCHQGCRLLPYGSTTTGLLTSNSRLDFTISTDNPEDTPQVILSTLIQSLNDDPFSILKYDETARFPMILASCNEPLMILPDLSPGQPTPFSINFDSNVILFNSQLLKAYCSCDERVSKFIILIKHWAKGWDINESNQTLSNFAWTLIGIGFLQLVQPAILPNLQSDEYIDASNPDLVVDTVVDDLQIRFSKDPEPWLSLQTGFLPNPTDASFGADPRPINPASVSSLFFGFLDFLNSFQFSMAFSIRHGRLVKTQSIAGSLQGKVAKDCFTILDPFRNSNNAAGRQHKSIIVRSAFQKSLDILKTTSLHDLLHPSEEKRKEKVQFENRVKRGTPRQDTSMASIQFCSPPQINLTEPPIHEEIEAFLANKNVQSDPATYEKIESFRLRLEGILKDKCHQGCRLLPYGSTTTGLLTSNSRLDFTISTDNPEDTPQVILSTLIQSLNDDPFSILKYDETARFPMILASCNEPLMILPDLSPDRPTPFSINFNKLVTPFLGDLVKTYCSCDERVSKFLIFIKHWAKGWDINDPGRGTLSNYAWTLIGIGFLQLVQPAILPNLQSDEYIDASNPDLVVDTVVDDLQIRFSKDPELWLSLQAGFLPNPTDASFGTDPRPINPASISSLFFGFLDFLNSFKLSMAFSIRHGRLVDTNSIAKSLHGVQAKGCFTILDPFRNSSNIAARQHKSIAVRSSLRKSLDIIKTSSLNDLLHPSEEKKKGLAHFVNRVKRDIPRRRPSPSPVNSTSPPPHPHPLQPPPISDPEQKRALLNDVQTILTDSFLFEDDVETTFISLLAPLDYFCRSTEWMESMTLISSSLNNISTKLPLYLSQSNVEQVKQDLVRIFSAISTFTAFMTGNDTLEAKVIEDKLFRIVFSPEKDNWNTRVYAVYDKHTEFLTTPHPFLNFKSSTGSGKTRCSPFIFAIKALQDNLQRPIFIMTQPSSAIVADKIADFTRILGDSVVLTSEPHEILGLLRQQITKPVIALLPPFKAVKLLVKAEQKTLDLIGRTRFCLDEIHERSVDTDILLAKLGEKCRANPFPLQVLMMSATPDERILKCFPSISHISLSDSQLFPIDDRKKEVERLPNTSKVAAEEVVEILADMVSGHREKGHFLVFTSTNNRMKEIDHEIRNRISPKTQPIFRTVNVLENMEGKLEKKSDFDHYLNKTIGTNTTTTFVMIVKYAGFVSSTAKGLIKQEMRQYPNLIKIIIGTEAIESSVTIDNLAAVVDCGIHNQASYDRAKGLTILTEEPISEKSQTQRRGRVGRTRDGVCVQIMIKDKPPINELPPSILTSDIAGDILRLRGIDLDLEKVQNLPDPIPIDDINNYLSELTSIGALDSQTRKLTEIGRELAIFSKLSPFLASSILATKAEAVVQSEEERMIVELVCFFIVLVFTSSRLVTDENNEHLRSNYCEDSDIVTLMLTLLQMRKCKGSTKDNALKFGLAGKDAPRIIFDVEDLMKKRAKDIARTTIWEKVEEYCSEREKLMDTIQKLIDCIRARNESYISCREASFLTVADCMNSPILIYQGHPSLSFSEDVRSVISVKNRPGQTGLSCPENCFVFEISPNTTTKETYGSLLHRNFTKPNQRRPISVKCEASLNNPFTLPLLKAYLETSEHFVGMFKSKDITGLNAGTEFCILSQHPDSAVVTAIPKNEDDCTILQKAIDSVRQVLPFVGRTVLLQHEVINCAVAMTSYGSDEMISKTIFFKDTKIRPYSMTQRSIDFLVQHRPLLASKNDEIVIAITGESLSIPLADSDNSQQKQDQFYNPCVSHKVTSVFSTDHYFSDHLVVLTELTIPGMNPLTWTRQTIHAEYTTKQYLVHTANQIMRGTIEVQSSSHLLLFHDPRDKLIVDGVVPQLPPDIQLDQTQSKSHPVTSTIERYSMFLNMNKSLTQPINLRGFTTDTEKKRGPRVPKKEMSADEKQEFERNKLRIQAIKAEEARIKDAWNSTRNKTTMIQQQAQLKNERQNLFNRNDSLKGVKHQKIHSIPFKEIKTFLKESKLGSLLHSDTINGIVSITVKNEDNNGTIKRKIDELCRTTTTMESIPLVGVTIHNRTDSGLKKNEFVSKISSVTQKFGAIVVFQKEYQESKTRQFHGDIFVQLLSSDFLLTFVTELERALVGEILTPLVFPSAIVPRCVMNRPLVQNCINDWLTHHKLTMIKRKGNKWGGPKEQVDRAHALLLDPENHPHIPFLQKTLDDSFDMHNVNKIISRQLRGKNEKTRWAIDIHNRLLLIPSTVSEKEYETVMKSLGASTPSETEGEQAELLGDYLYCGDVTKRSKRRLNVYQRDGTIQMKPFCLDCLEDLFNESTKSYVAGGHKQPHMTAIVSNPTQLSLLSLVDECSDVTESEQPERWPMIPLAQQMVAFLDEPSLKPMVQIWVSVNGQAALRKSPKLVCCPEHPTILMPRPPRGTRLSCSHLGCKLFLCADCGQWHPPNQCKNKLVPPLGYRFCPNCKCMSYKETGCNRVCCNNCSIQYCYTCGLFTATDSGSVYAHLGKEHGDFFADPPDYRKSRGENVSDSELKAFYTKYPHLSPD